MRFVAIPAKTLQKLVALLLFRLGGEQTFTSEEIKDIQSSMGGVMMFIDADERVILRSRPTPNVPKEDMEEEEQQKYNEDYREEEE